MSQNEEGEGVDVDVATDTGDNQEENTTSDDEWVTWEELAQLRKDSESLRKANKKIATMEKDKKVPETKDTANLSEDALDALLEKRDFYKSNANAKDHRDEIEAMITASKWKVDRQKAFDMLSGDAEVEENRKVYGRAIVEWGKSGTTWFSAISVDRYDKLSSAEQEAYNAKSKAKNGGVIFK